ncbi:MAG: translocation/assembly module TamB domain-containing protein, partial [Abditibacteriota bacterium]|nr:translocation/assembly module TamB domain-containing protein [Abditibacteriota bacterium]
GVKISDFETADIFGGYAKAAGTYKNGVFDMRFAAPGADVGRVGSFFGAGGLTGTAFVSGTLTGTAANPKTNAVAEVHGFGAGDNKIDFARIPFSTSGRTVSFNDAELAVFPAGAVLNGSVTPSKDGKEITYEGKARLSRLDIATLNKKLQTKLPGNGVLSGDFDISGTYHPGTEITLDTIMNSDMKLSGTVEFEDAAFYDFPLDKASAKVEIADRKLSISDCDAKSALASVSVSGIVDTAADTYDMDFSLKDFHLSRIRKFREEYASITGSVSGSGKITGTFDEPVITAKAESADLVLSHQRFEKALFDIDLQGNDFRNFEVSLIDGKSLLSFSGTHLDMDSKTVELAEGIAENIDMKSIWDMFRSSRFVTPSRRPRRSDSENRTEDENRKAPRFAAANNLTVGSGKLDADFRVSGSLKTPEISLDGTVKDLTVNGKRIENLDIDADGSEGTVFLRSLKVSSGNLAAEAEGLFDLDGSGTDLALRAKDVDLRELGRFVNIGDVSGTASSELRITGDLTAPEIAGFLTTENPAYGSVAFDSFDIGSVAVRDNRVEISDVSLTKGGCLVTADGYVPWDWKKFRVPKEDSLAFTVTAEDKGFDMISAFVKDIDKEKTKGDLTAFINVLGTLSEPELTGKLTVTEGTLGLHTFDNLFTSINADINLSGNSLTVDNLTASSDLGGTLYVKKGGKVTLGRNSESIDMEVVAEKLALKERNAFGLGETAETVLDADVTLTGDKLKNMLIADAKEGESGIKIGRTVVSVLKSKTAAAETVAAEPEKKKSAINFDPEFALHAESGGDLILAQPMFTVMAGGKGVIDGSLSDMTADSMLSVSKGTIKVAGNRLKITPGGNIKAMYTSGKPAEVRLDLQATANARIANAFGRRELYKIIVDVDGALDNLNIRTTSSPPGLSREQMLAAMGHVEGMLAGSNNMFENDITDAFKSVGASMLFMPIEDLFIDKLGFDDFYLDYGTAKDMSLYVSKRLFGNYFLSYYQQFSGNVVGTDNTMKLELQYRFKDRYTVGIGTDDQHAFRITADWTYLFD